MKASGETSPGCQGEAEVGVGGLWDREYGGMTFIEVEAFTLQTAPA